jgi:hypothetical protein
MTGVAIPSSRIHSTRSSFILFVDGMFTTFIEPPFTNTFEANAQNRAVHCV